MQNDATVRRDDHTSTGPRTDAGKAISSMNSLKHGLTSRRVVLPGEDQAEFDRLHNQLLSDHAPVGALETEIVAEIAACLWRLQRARRYESTILETSAFELFVNPTQAKGFETLLRYMGSIERQLNRAILRLRETQAARRRSAASQSRVKAMSATSYTPSQFVSLSEPDPVLATSHEQLAPELTTDHRPLTTAPDGCPQAA